MSNVNGIAVAGLAIGIASLLYNPFFAGSILAIACGVIGRRREAQRGLATAGIALGATSAVIGAIFVAYMKTGA